MENNICCPKFNPEPWEGTTHDWNDKPFLTATMPVIFHIPLPWVINKTIRRLWERAQEYSIAADVNDFLMLCQDPSPWKSRFFLAVTGGHPDVDDDIVRISGKFISKVFDGPYKDMPKYINEINDWLSAEGKVAKEFFFYCTTCPKCAPIHGHNYIVIFARV